MATAVAPRIFKNFINGEWVGIAERESLREPQSGEHG